ncbi:Telomerase reverse transcriptase [Elasticomyces elasticus]|nr:Telomerase reverse transcriptase [Elasticomyces elasticus]
MKRKRKTRSAPESSLKRVKPSCELGVSLQYDQRHHILRQFYPRLYTLRDYLLSKLPNASKKRRRKIAELGHCKAVDISATDQDRALTVLLDTVVVGTSEQHDSREDQIRMQEIEVFSQQLEETTLGSLTPESLSQKEVVDFVIWLLFRKHRTAHRPPHILCHGFQRAATGGQHGLNLSVAPGIPGLLSYSPNAHVETLKNQPWSSLPSLIGKDAQRVLIDLFMECGIYIPVNAGNDNLSQISGTPLPDLPPLPTVSPMNQDCMGGDHGRTEKTSTTRGTPSSLLHSVSQIRFVRQRMLYAGAAINTKGNVCFGMGNIFVMNRYPHVDDSQETTHVMKYIFPRQFSLHNVFTSKTSSKDTAQSCKDYTLREHEIRRASINQGIKRSGIDDSKNVKGVAPPRRLRGEATLLIERLRKRHARCAYVELLRHYCSGLREQSRQEPDAPLQKNNQSVGALAGPTDTISATCKPKSRPSLERTSFIDAASPVAQVSAFCRAVVARVFPNRLWGDGDTGLRNKTHIMRSIDHFIRMRRFETMSLHDAMQGIKISGIVWLSPHKLAGNANMARTDSLKRVELLQELVYYLFDSFLITLIRSNFYVTESNVHRNRLFYFRHDVWQRLSRPMLTELKDSMFEKLKAVDIKKVLTNRATGFSQVRLLPKETGMRPIINLRRRVQKRVNGETVLGRSINSTLSPAFSVLNYEKSKQPERLGCSLFSVGDIFPKLHAFQTALEKRGLAGKPLFFAKVDVHACFDTIPQMAMISLLKEILRTEEYCVTRHAEVKLVEDRECSFKALKPRTAMRFPVRAWAVGEPFDFGKLLDTEAADGKSHTAFVDGVVQKIETRRKVMNLLNEHVQSNIVKIGKCFYRQKVGIPQGSVVSSLLCSFFYADLERECLSFVQDGNSILFRLIDDFLVISTKQETAERFLRVMHAGSPQYGVKIKPEKSKANFDCKIDGRALDRLPAMTDFPYCGKLINTVTLDIRKDEARRHLSGRKSYTSTSVAFR